MLGNNQVYLAWIFGGFLFPMRGGGGGGNVFLGPPSIFVAYLGFYSSGSEFLF